MDAQYIIPANLFAEKPIVDAAMGGCFKGKYKFYRSCLPDDCGTTIMTTVITNDIRRRCCHC
ncbi:MAG: hypothetical protein AB8U44_04310 [Aaplasma endosymbiont of Hyalomma asiaticum]